jgi:hypothetical protein
MCLSDNNTSLLYILPMHVRIRLLLTFAFKLELTLPTLLNQLSTSSILHVYPGYGVHL